MHGAPGNARVPPASAGCGPAFVCLRVRHERPRDTWIPACAGMTGAGRTRRSQRIDRRSPRPAATARSVGRQPVPPPRSHGHRTCSLPSTRRHRSAFPPAREAGTVARDAASGRRAHQTWRRFARGTASSASARACSRRRSPRSATTARSAGRRSCASPARPTLGSTRMAPLGTLVSHPYTDHSGSASGRCGRDTSVPSTSVANVRDGQPPPDQPRIGHGCLARPGGFMPIAPRPGKRTGSASRGTPPWERSCPARTHQAGSQPTAAGGPRAAVRTRRSPGHRSPTSATGCHRSISRVSSMRAARPEAAHPQLVSRPRLRWPDRGHLLRRRHQVILWLRRSPGRGRRRSRSRHRRRTLVVPGSCLVRVKSAEPERAEGGLRWPTF